MAGILTPKQRRFVGDDLVLTELDVIRTLLDGSPDVSVHTFRHTHISHALDRQGRNPPIVQRWVGHLDLQTTHRYHHVDLEDLKREARKVGDES